MSEQRDAALAWEQAARREVFAQARFTDREGGEFTRLMNNYRAACRSIERAETADRAPKAIPDLIQSEEA